MYIQIILLVLLRCSLSVIQRPAWLTRLGLSYCQIDDLLTSVSSSSPTSLASDTNHRPNDEFKADLNDEITWIRETFPKGFYDQTVTPMCQSSVDGSSCLEVVIAQAGTHLDKGKSERRNMIGRLRAKVDPEYRKKAKHELTVIIEVPRQYPAAEPILKITDWNGFTKKDVRRLEHALQMLAKRRRRFGRRSLKLICQRALRFVSDPDDALKTQKWSFWVVVGIAVVLLFLFKYVQWKMKHTTTIIHQ
jgi:RWD domain-containing protein